jgi:hypothetical protein
MMFGKIRRKFVLERCGDGTQCVEVTETTYGRLPWWDITRKCAGCGETVNHSVRTLQNWVDKPQFCSWECRWRYGRRIRRHKERTCVVCENSFTTTRRDASNCSNACRQRAHRMGSSGRPSPARTQRNAQTWEILRKKRHPCPTRPVPPHNCRHARHRHQAPPVAPRP